MDDLISRTAAIVQACKQIKDDYVAFDVKEAIKNIPSAQTEPCDLCSDLEKGDTLYQYSDWDGGIGFDYIKDIQFCPKCGRRLEEW